MNQNKIYTIGHSTRSPERFLEILKSIEIRCLADIRGLPGSKRYPHFNKEALEISLPENHIRYVHLRNLGGRRKTKKDSQNTGWKNDAFRGYADYMETDAFTMAVQELEDIARNERTAYMCAEGVWWRCHRSLVSDYLKLKGWDVIHIMDKGKSMEHHYTSPARVIDGKLTYGSE